MGKYKIKANGEEIFFTEINDFIDWALNNDKIVQIMDQELEPLNEFISYYKIIKNKCTKEIKKYNDNLNSSEQNEILKNAVDKFVYLNSDGKFLRATLTALGYQSIKKDDNYIPLALAIEIFQTSILIHDDIIDKALKRRGKDTIPVMYKKENVHLNDDFKPKLNDVASSMAICLGDLGFYLANQMLLKYYQNSPNLSKILFYYNDVVIKTIKGELLDVFLPFKEETLQHTSNLEKQIMEIYTLKTAWYSVIGPFCLGMVLAGADDILIKQTEKVLLDVGVAFQIKDDLLGIYGDEITTGKTASDIKEYKQTILYSYALNTDYKEELLKYYGTDNTGLVRDIFTKSGARKYAEEKMQERFAKAMENLKTLNLSQEVKNILLGFISFIQNREK